MSIRPSKEQCRSYRERVCCSIIPRLLLNNDKNVVDNCLVNVVWSRIFCWPTIWYFSKRTSILLKNCMISLTLIMVICSYLHYNFFSLCSGWNHRWCLYGSVRFTDEEWKSPCARNRETVIKPLKRNYVFQNTTQTKTAIKAPDRNSFRYWIK